MVENIVTKSRDLNVSTRKTRKYDNETLLQFFMKANYSYIEKLL